MRQTEYINRFRRWLDSRKVPYQADLYNIYLFEDTVKVDFRVRDNGTLISWRIQSQVNTGPGTQKRSNLASDSTELYKAAAAVHHHDRMILKAREARDQVKRRERESGMRTAETFMAKIEHLELPIVLRENQIVISDTLVLDFKSARAFVRGPINIQHLEILLGVDK